MPKKSPEDMKDLVEKLRKEKSALIEKNRSLAEIIEEVTNERDEEKAGSAKPSDKDISSAVTAYYTTGIENWKYTSYAYDGIGRVTTMTNADSTSVSHEYTDWQDTVTNERGYKKRYFYDAFG